MYLTSFTVQNFLQLIFYLVVLVGVLFAAYYVTKWIAGSQKSQMYNQNFEIIETLKITNNKFLQIVRVGKDEYFVIAIGKDEIHFLSRIDESQLSFTENAGAPGDFSGILSGFVKRVIPGNKNDKGEES